MTTREKSYNFVDCFHLKCITVLLQVSNGDLTLSETESKSVLSIYLLCHFEIAISQFSCLLKSLTSLSQVPYYWWPCLILERRMKVKVKSLSSVWLSATPWTAAHQAPPSMGFSRQEHWSGLPFPSPSNFLKEISNLSHSVIFLCFFVLFV